MGLPTRKEDYRSETLGGTCSWVTEARSIEFFNTFGLQPMACASSRKAIAADGASLCGAPLRACSKTGKGSSTLSADCGPELCEQERMLLGGGALLMAEVFDELPELSVRSLKLN
jgi:hypothetical protein